jgi:hypothetical protein
MKKTLFLPALLVALLSFSSFTSMVNTTAKSIKMQKIAGVSFRDAGTITGTDIYTLCNGHLVEMTYTLDYTVHGVINNNRAMFNYSAHLTGTGVDLNTGEVYTWNTTNEFIDNIPITKGAYVSKWSFDENIVGDQGSLQKFIFDQRFTITPDGTFTVFKYTFTQECQ